MKRAHIALALAATSSVATAQPILDDAAGFGDAAATHSQTEVAAGYLCLRSWSLAERAEYPSLAGNSLLLHLDEASVVNGTPVSAAGAPPAGVAPVFESAGDADHAVPGVLGNALLFNPASQDRLPLLGAPADLASSASALTLMAWFNPRVWPATSDTMKLLSIGGATGTRADFALWGPDYLCTIANAPDAPSQSTGADVPAFRRPGEWSHYAVVFEFSPTDRITYYLDGRLLDSVPVDFPGTSTSAALSPTAAVGSAEDSAADLFDGSLDEVSVWKRALGAAEIAEIHRRQSGPFGSPQGTFTSRPLAATQDVAWTSIGWTPRAPYGKPLPDANQNESGYLEGNADMSANVLLLHADGTGLLANGQMLNDASSHGHSARTINTNGAGSTFVPGRLGQGVHLVPPDYLSIDTAATSAELDFGTGGFTWAGWVRTAPCGANDQVVLSAEAVGGDPLIRLGGGCSGSCDGARAQWVLSAGGSTTSICSDVRLDDEAWHHVAGVKSAQVGTAVLYVDGRRYVEPTSFAAPFDFDQPFLLGQSAGLSTPSNVYVDELAIWQRALSEAEVQALFHRGALRLRLQVRTCLDAPCTGSFVGPDGTSGTVFSEATALALEPPSAAPLTLPSLAPGQYLDYRVLLESDDSTASPELASVSFVTTAVPLPDAVADWYDLTPGVPFTAASPGVLSNDSASGPLTALLASGPAHGTVDLLPSGEFTYTPAGEYVGTDAFTYRAFDGAVRSAPAQVTLNVLGLPPDAPVITSPAADAVLHTTTPQFAGTAPAGTAVEVSVDGSLCGESPADSTGHWTLSLDAAQRVSNGSHAVTAVARSEYGARSVPSAPVAFRVEAAGFLVTCGCGASAGTLAPLALALLARLLRRSRRYPWGSDPARQVPPARDLIGPITGGWLRFDLRSPTSGSGGRW